MYSGAQIEFPKEATTVLQLFYDGVLSVLSQVSLLVRILL